MVIRGWDGWMVLRATSVPGTRKENNSATKLRDIRLELGVPQGTVLGLLIVQSVLRSAAVNLLI